MRLADSLRSSRRPRYHVTYHSAWKRSLSCQLPTAASLGQAGTLLWLMNSQHLSWRLVLNNRPTDIPEWKSPILSPVSIAVTQEDRRRSTTFLTGFWKSDYRGKYSWYLPTDSPTFMWRKMASSPFLQVHPIALMWLCIPFRVVHGSEKGLGHFGVSQALGFVGTSRGVYSVHIRHVWDALAAWKSVNVVPESRPEKGSWSRSLVQELDQTLLHSDNSWLMATEGSGLWPHQKIEVHLLWCNTSLWKLSCSCLNEPHMSTWPLFPTSGLLKIQSFVCGFLLLFLCLF